MEVVLFFWLVPTFIIWFWRASGRAMGAWPDWKASQKQRLANWRPRPAAPPRRVLSRQERIAQINDEYEEECGAIDGLTVPNYVKDALKDQALEQATEKISRML